MGIERLGHIPIIKDKYADVATSIWVFVFYSNLESLIRHISNADLPPIFLCANFNENHHLKKVRIVKILGICAVKASRSLTRWQEE